MNRWTISLILTLSVCFQTHSTGQEIGFIEDYALAQDRDAVLKRLVPGTEEYYYFHALHYQNTGQPDRVAELLKPWIKRFGRTATVQMIENRQALLAFDGNPEATYTYVAKRLGLDFNHQREIPSSERNLPTQFDPKLIDPERLLKDAFRRHSNTAGIETIGLEQVDLEALGRVDRRHLLSRLTHPDLSKLVPTIAKDLREKDSRGFGSLAIHGNLTISQLDQLRKEIPKLIDNTNFVNTYMRKLQPSDDVNWRSDREQHLAYLQRLQAFVVPLNPNFNSLKACVLYRRLELDRLNGEYDRNLFIQYLKLPREMSYVNPELIKSLSNRSHIVQLGADFRQPTRLFPVGNDEALVREYLHHFFVQANNYDAFRPYVRDTYLKRQFASAKILAGLGDRERWASSLSPAQYKQLLERVDLDFALTNQEFFDDDDVVEIDLFTKNVKQLIVKVYQINTFNFYRKHLREIDTDINLDGLVANFEETHEFKEPPARRIRRSFQFDQLENDGVYVVDFIGGGKSSRALIRRGRLSVVGQPTVAGQRFRVFDQNSKRLKDATLWMAGRRYQPDEDGWITVPFSTRPAVQSMIITHAGFSSLQRVSQLAENYSFDAGLFVDRESLLFSEKAQLLVRPALNVAGVPASVKLLTDAELTITSVNHDGISTTKRLEDLQFSDEVDTACEFIVPPRLKSIRFDLVAKVENVSRNRSETLRASRKYDLNQIDTSDEIQDVHLMPTAAGYVLEVRGKSGEARPGQAVRIEMKHRDVVRPISVDLQSSDGGQIILGQLPGIVRLKTRVAGGSDRQWVLRQPSSTRPTKVHAVLGQPIQVAAPIGLKSLKPSSISLFEKRGGTFVVDRFDHLSFSSGQLSIENLPAGDFELRLKQSGESIQISVVAGVLNGGVVMGQHRRLEMRDPLPLIVQGVDVGPKDIHIQLENSGPLTRVHVFGSRYQPRFDAFEEYSRIRDVAPWTQRVAVRRSAYMAGRKLGDEYQYILDRKYAQKYPGNMLERPSILISPWSIRDTNNKVESLAEGDDFAVAGTDEDGRADRKESERQQQATLSDFSNLDFLSQSSVTLMNLKPNDEGAVLIDKEKLRGLQHVRIVALDAQSTIQRDIKLSPSDIELRDLRLAHALEPNEHFTQMKQIEVLGAGDVLTIEDLVSGKFQYFDDLGDVFRLFLALNPNTALAEFEFLLSWSERSDEEKQTLYSKHACHELNFYLYKKDRAFFDRVVQPHVAFKSERGLIDHFLVSAEMGPFRQPWQYSKLNTLERILLAQRLETHSANIVRSIEDQYLLNPTRRDRFDSLYDSSIHVNDMFFEDLSRKRAELSNQRSIKALEKKLPSLARGGRGRVPAPRSALGGGGGGAAGVGGLIAAGKKPSSQGIALGFDLPADGEQSDKIFANSVDRRARFKEVLKSESKTRNFLRLVDEHDEDSLGLEGAIMLGAQLQSIRESNKSLYRRLPPTKEWIEQQYYKRPLNQQTPDLVAPNRFWRDYARHTGGPFLSQYFSESHRSLPEMLGALAVLDLPEKAPRHQFEYAGNSLSLTAGGALIALHQQFRPAVLERQNTSILLTENFFQKNDRYRHQDGIRYDKFVADRFLAHTLYGAQVVVTNPTSTPQTIDLLIQIPRGSVATSGAQETRSVPIQLDAFSTKTYEYFFYFPTAGSFAHFPAHVSRGEKVLAVADSVEFEVTDEPAQLDKSSWAYVSQNGSDDDVINFLNQENVFRLDLQKIAFRMSNKAFFERAIEALRNRYVFHPVLWSYGIKHRDSQASSEFMSQESRIAGNVGRSFESPLLSIDPYDRNWYQHREYRPLVNARAHKVSTRRKILNPAFHQQYHLLLDVLANRQTLTSRDHLIITYYLLLQDRIGEAINHFGMVKKEELDEEIQFDYCSAYLDFYLEDLDSASSTAKKWSDYPVDLWRKRFQNILAQVDEIKGGQTRVTDKRDDTQTMTELAAQSEAFDFELDAGMVKIDAQHVGDMTINFYQMDIELMFSRSPFTQQNLDGFSVIRPNHTETLRLAGEAVSKREFPLPENLAKRNVLVEIIAGDQVKARPYFASSMTLQTYEKYGQLQVLEEENRKPVSKAYVKVYAQTKDGKVRFHKDGYTDLRGRFDYVSQSNNPLDDVAQYSILVLSSQFGAETRQVAAPAE